MLTAKLKDVDLSTGQLSQRRLRTWLRLLRFVRATENELREFLRVEHETTLPRFDVAAALFRNGGAMKMSALSAELLVSNGNTTTVVSGLEREGHVLRRTDQMDRRSVQVSLTEQGKAWFEKLAAAHEMRVDKLFAKLSNAELDQMKALLRQVDETSSSEDITENNQNGRKT